MSTTNQITLNFFGETVSVPNPQSLSTLRNNIANLFYFSPEDAKEILITYNENGDRIVIENDEDLKAFLNSKINTIDLDISQTSQIYQKNLESIKQENEKDKLNLDNLLKRQEELEKMKETEFGKEREEIKKIKEQIIELRKQKLEIKAKIMKGMHKINTEKRENNKKIVELQKKLGLPINKPKPKQYHKDKMNKQKHMKKRPCQMMPFAFPFGFYNQMKPFDFFNPQNKKGQEKRNKTIDEWGKCLLNKTQEITTKLAETFKDFPIFTIPFGKEEEKKKEKKEEKKEEKEIHRFVRCDGCGMHPLIGKRYKCKICPNFDYCEKCLEKNKETHQHEFINIPPRKRPGHIHNFNHMKKLQKMKEIKKKLEKSKTTENIFEKKEKEVKEEENKNEIKTENKNNLAEKLVHFGVKCDGCGTFPIIGCRFKCAVCDDFDFCEECEKKLGEEHNHPFLKIYDPKMTPISFKCLEKK